MEYGKGGGAMIHGIICVFGGVVLVYIGALQIVGACLPSAIAEEVGRRHGEWVRSLVTRDHRHE